MSANGHIHRAMVQAGSTADTTEHVLEFGTEHGAPAVVHEHHVKIGRAVEVTRTFPPEEVFEVQVTSPVGSEAVLVTFPVQPDRSYHLQYKEHLGEDTWRRLEGELKVEAGIASQEDPSAGSGLQRFYRALAEPLKLANGE